MKHKFLLILILTSCVLQVQASTNLPVNLAPVSNTIKTTSTLPPQSKPATVTTDFEYCVKSFDTSVENLFFLTLAAINASGYKIDEVQSRTGFVSFLVGNKPFLASITQINDNSAMVKITPMDNSYNFSPAIIERIFNYLQTNVK